MRFNNPNEYGDAVLFVAGCDCHPKRIIQQWDETGAFTVEHQHEQHCAMHINGQLWHARYAGSVAADTSTKRERYERRLKAIGGL